MKSRILSIILSVFLFSQVSFAQLCAKLVDVRAGEDHILALSEDGFLFSCGGGNGGMALGLGGISQVYSFQRVHGPNNVGYFRNIVIFDAGWFHSLAVDSSGVFWSFGNDTSGQLGNGDDGSSNVPVKVHGLNNDVNGLRNIVMVSAGRSGTHSLAVDSNGYVYGFGNNSSYQCGDESNTERQYPVLVVDSCDQTTGIYLGDEAFIVDVEAGVSHSLVLVRFEDGGFVYEWGNGYSYKTPRKVPGENGTGFLRNIVDIATCGYSLAADSNGNVWKWDVGGNPTRIPGGQMGTEYLENIVKVAAGSGVYVALDANGNVWELQSGSPVKITDGQQNSATGYLEGIVALDVGYYDQRVVIDEYGHGFGWGSNRYGSLGIGNIDSPTEPTEMLCADISPSVEFTLSYEIDGLEPNCAKPFIGWGIDDNYLVFSIVYSNPITNPSDPNYVGTISDVNIINELPLEVEYYSSDPCGVYDANTRRIIWHIGDLSPGEEGILILTVKVNEYAKPCGEIIDFAHLTGDGYYTYADVNVPVCPWGGEIIYVNDDANGFNNGTDWQNAYIDLQDAFSQARSNCTEITATWVAGGTYKPVETTGTNYQNESFELIDGVALFGYFAGDENSPDERNFADANNETILDGQIGANYYDAVYKVLKAENITAGLIDGVTIKNASQYGLFMDYATIGIANCKFSNNYSYGVYVGNYSYPDIHNCLFMDNASYSIYAVTSEPDVSYCVFDGNSTTSYGLYITSYSVSNITNSDFKNHNSGAVYGSNATITISDCNLSSNSTAISGSSGTLNVSGCSLYSNYYAIQGYSGTADIENCKLFQNNYYGIEGSDLNLTVKHTIFEDNAQNGIRLNSGSDIDIQNSVVRNSGSQGIYLSYNSSTQIINNWIHNNGKTSSAAGIYLENQVGIPLVRNNTIYDNGTYGIERNSTGADPNILNCIIYGNDTNDIYRPSGTFSKVKYCLLQRTYGTNNIIGDPCFANPSNENDLHISKDSICKNAGYLYGVYGENETDIDGEGRVENGRIDIGGDECYISPADYDDSDIVNFFDFSYLAKDWQTSQSDHSLDDDNDVDVQDLALFCEDWLWQNAAEIGGWMLWSGSEEMMMGMSGGGLACTPAVQDDETLMLSTVAESIAKQPVRLKTNFQKFYDIMPDKTISAKQRQLESLKAQRVKRMSPSKAIEPTSLSGSSAIESAEAVEEVFDVNETLGWLDDIWQSGDLTGSMTEAEYLEFRNSIENSRE